MKGFPTHEVTAMGRKLEGWVRDYGLSLTSTHGMVLSVMPATVEEV